MPSSTTRKRKATPKRGKASTKKRTTTAGKTSGKKKKATTKSKSSTRKSKSTTKSSRAKSKSNGSSNGSGEISNYSSAMRWLNEHTDFERLRLVKYNPDTFNLDRMRKLLKALGNPHEQVRFVHIAGTKGKGSTVSMLASMLQHCGYAIGTYTSPHLIDIRERIQINGDMIPHADFVELLKSVQTKVKYNGSNNPTFFEVITAVAMRYFADQAVDLAILETGLGGRLDATNVVEPEVVGLTQISIDHTNILGKKITQIAAEKAGIMKKGVPAITVEQEPEVMKVFREHAEKIGAPLEENGKEIEFSYRFEANRELGPHTRVCLTTPNDTYDHLPVPLKGEHQALNCGLALALLDKLREKGFKATEDQWIEGLAATVIPGRMEMAWKEPRIMLDGAHNAASITSLIRAMGAHVPYDSLVMIFGCGEDKDVIGMLKQVNLGADKVIFTKAKGNPRASEPKDLLTKFRDVSGKMAQSAESLDEALQLAARAVGREDLICITGSFYLVGEAKKYLADLASKRKATN
ncbi:MAG: hypothetical protein GC159_21955 [Phycisphaera sp.]|nr:hypothetical protein [Phycisphaera sp.]